MAASCIVAAFSKLTTRDYSRSTQLDCAHKSVGCVDNEQQVPKKRILFEPSRHDGHHCACMFEQKDSRHYSAIAAFCEMNGLVYGKYILLRIMVLCGVTPKELLCTAVESMAPLLILSAQQEQEEEEFAALPCVCVWARFSRS